MSSPVGDNIERVEFGQIVRSAVQDYVYVVDKAGKLVDANNRFLSDLGIQPPQMKGTSVESLINEEDKAIARLIWQSITDTKRAERCIRRMRSLGGNQRILDITETPIVKEARVLGIVGVARDVTEESALEDKIWETQENSEAALEYAVRASLGLIKGYVFSLQRMERLPNEQKERYSKVIVDEIETLSRNIENLLISRGQYAEVGEGNLCNVSEILKGVAKLLKAEATRREITLTVEAHDEEILLHTQSEAVQRIILNLADFCLLRVTHSGEVKLGVSDFEEYLEISIQDTGPAINDKEIAELGETGPAVSEAEGGSIGSKIDLYVARLLCDSLGGGLTARATKDNHLEFIVMLPRKAAHLVGHAAVEMTVVGK